MRKPLKVLMWVGIALLAVTYLAQYAQLIPQPTVGANDFYWLLMGALGFLTYVGNVVGAVLVAGVVLIHFGIDRRDAAPARPVADSQASQPESA